MKFHTNQIIKMTDTLDGKFHNRLLLGENVLVVRYTNADFEGFPVIKVLDEAEIIWYVSEFQMKLAE